MEGVPFLSLEALSRDDSATIEFRVPITGIGVAAESMPSIDRDSPNSEGRATPPAEPCAWIGQRRRMHRLAA